MEQLAEQNDIYEDVPENGDPNLHVVSEIETVTEDTGVQLVDNPVDESYVPKELDLENYELNDGVEPHDEIVESKQLDLTPGESSSLDSFNLFIKRATKAPLLTASQEIDLAKRIERGDLEAKNKMVESNLRLVISIANKYKYNGHMTFEDLIQEGVIGLTRATEKFDWRTGNKFSTYAVLWIRQSLQKGIENTGPQIRLPSGVARKVGKIGAAQHRLNQEKAEDPSIDEIAVATGLKSVEVERLMQLTRVTTSLEKPLQNGQMDDSGSSSFGDMIVDEKSLDEGVKTVYESDKNLSLQSALDKLPDELRQVIDLRFGINNEGKRLTLIEIGKMLGVSGEQVRQIEKRALVYLSNNEKLRKASHDPENFEAK